MCSDRMTPLRIGLAISKFGGAGPPRVMVRLAQEFIAAGYPVDLIVACNDGLRSADIPDGVRVIDLEALHSPFSFWRLTRKGRYRMLAGIAPLSGYFDDQRPDAVLSAGNYVNFVCLRARRRATYEPRLVVSHHSHYSLESSGQPFARWIVRHAYPAADAIVAVSDGVADDLAASARLPRGRITTIHNPVVSPALIAKSKDPPLHPWLKDTEIPVFVAAGRLMPQKDFPTLIRAFASLRKARPARLIILGEGRKRAALEELVGQLDLADDVDLPGHAENPFAYMSRAAAFVLSSAWEGFPLVLVEALACGCPVVSTNCPSGPAEILENGRYGRLVPVGDADAMAVAMAAALDCPGDPAARRNRAAQFSRSAAAQRYLELFRSLNDPQQ